MLSSHSFACAGWLFEGQIRLLLEMQTLEESSVTVLTNFIV